MNMYGICQKCNNTENSHVQWCKNCDSVNSISTGNDAVDKFLQNTLQSADRYHKVIEWIPFNRLKDIKEIGKGGFSTVFSATWIDGKRISIDEKGEKREKEIKVALKMLDNSKNISDTFLKEIEHHHMYSSINLYGLTQDWKTKNYMMVLKFANSGNLREYIKSNFRDEEFNWEKKLSFLQKIANELIKIHNDEKVHRDFHDGNILIHSNNYPCISDLGLAGPANAKDEGKGVYGVLPYVAPEVLYGKKYTADSDIYSFGIIMTEFSSGEPPHWNIPHDTTLAIGITEGLRPECGKGTPNRYIELANRCMDAEPLKRPNANECYELLTEWCNAFRFAGSERERKEDALIRNEFETADKIISNLSSSQKHSGAIYNSRLLSSCLDLEKLTKYTSKITPMATPTSFKFPSDEEESPNE